MTNRLVSVSSCAGRFRLRANCCRASVVGQSDSVLPLSAAPQGCHPECTLSSREADTESRRALALLSSRNTQVLRREPFALRRTPLPQDDRGVKVETDPLPELRNSQGRLSPRGHGSIRLFCNVRQYPYQVSVMDIEDLRRTRRKRN